MDPGPIFAAYNVIYVLQLYEVATPYSGLLASLDPGGEKRLKNIKMAIAAAKRGYFEAIPL